MTDKPKPTPNPAPNDHLGATADHTPVTSAVATPKPKPQTRSRDRRLDDLNPVFRPLAERLIAKCVEAGIAVMIVETMRTEAQHQDDLASGHSWIKRSKHQDGLAIDLAPYEIYQLHGPDKLRWDAGDPTWQVMGQIGETLGLVWGGRWAVRDMGHFEMSKP